MLYLAYKYSGRDEHSVCGIFETEDLAWAALVEAHGTLESAKLFGDVEEFALGKSECTGSVFAPVAALAPVANQTPAQVRNMPLSANYTPAQALQVALQSAEQLQEVLIIGQYLPEDDKQALFVLPSRSSMLMAVWLHRRLGHYIDTNA